MSRKIMSVLLLVMVSMLLFAGCGGGGGHHDPTPPTDTVSGNVTIQDAVQSSAFNARNASFSPTLVQGMYFRELEVVAYSYRPGQTTQSSFNAGGFANPDWSYWVLLQSGTDAGRNNILKKGQSLNMGQLNSGNVIHIISDEYIKNVGTFTPDILEINIGGSGIIYDNKYYGNVQEPDMFIKFPEYQSIPQYPAFVNYPGNLIDPSSLSILFIRSDWFPNPVTLTKQAGVFIPTNGSVLTQQQSDMIAKFVQAGTMRRIYNNFIIVPFSGRIPVKFTTNKILNGDYPVIVQTYDANITVTFDLSDLLDDTTNLETTPYKIVYKENSANHVPFKASISMTHINS